MAPLLAALRLAAVVAIACLIGLRDPAAARGADAAPASAWAETRHGAVRLVSAVTGTGDAQHLTLGLQFALAPGWKIYWRSPGDAGYPPRIDWTGSTNLATAELSWPQPQRFTVLGFETIGYAGDVVLPIAIGLARPGEALTIAALVEYLTCDEICVPYTARLTLALPAGPALPSPHAALIGSHAARIPRLVTAFATDAELLVEDARVVGAGAETRLAITVRALEALQAPDVFVETTSPELAFAAPVVSLAADGRRAVLDVAVFGAEADPLADQTLRLTIVDGARAIEQEVRATPGGRGQATDGSAAIVRILAVALLGGVILNLMPCVLPVLSIKLLAIAAHGGQDRPRIRWGFLASAAGIVTSFVALAAALALVKLAGGSIGWGVQFQQPWFLAAITILVVLFACNLLGLFEVPLPRAIADAGARIGHAQGLGGQFLMGALATLLATPCSAPFVGTALGFALSRGTAEIFAVFIALGLGLALPYLAIAAAPALVAHLPRPGRWMRTLKLALAAALALTALWLLSVLAGVGGHRAAILAGATAGLVAGALGLAQRRSKAGRGVAAIAASGLVLAVAVAELAAQPPSARNDGPWQAFAPERIAALVASGRIVYVNVTADWCLTCKLNEQLVLARPPVHDRLAAPAVVAMRGDWTRPDATIASFLASFGRYGIPFDAVYGPGLPHGWALPELLTAATVEDALARAGSGARAGLPGADNRSIQALDPRGRRGVAQSGSASALGAEGRWFESSLPDQLSQGVRPQRPARLGSTPVAILARPWPSD